MCKDQLWIRYEVLFVENGIAKLNRTYVRGAKSRQKHNQCKLEGHVGNLLNAKILPLI